MSALLCIWPDSLRSHCAATSPPRFLVSLEASPTSSHHVSLWGLQRVTSALAPPPPVVPERKPRCQSGVELEVSAPEGINRGDKVAADDHGEVTTPSEAGVHSSPGGDPVWTPPSRDRAVAP